MFLTLGRLKVLFAAEEERLETEDMTRPDLFASCPCWPLFLITLYPPPLGLYTGLPATGLGWTGIGPPPPPPPPLPTIPPPLGRV